MAAQVKCVHCKNQVDKENCTQLSTRRYVCNNCLEEYTLLEKQRQTEADAYKDLIDYICQLFSIKAPTLLIVSQIKRFKDEYGYTYQGMKATLEYFFELQHNSLENSSGVGIIPYVYDEVKKFYADKKALQKQIEKYDLNNPNVNVNNVTIKHYSENMYKDMAIIPLDDIEEDDND